MEHRINVTLKRFFIQDMTQKRQVLTVSLLHAGEDGVDVL